MEPVGVLGLDVDDKPFLGGSLERDRPSRYAPAPRGWSKGTQASLPLHAPRSYPLFASGEPQDVAHDFFIHAAEQLLPGGTQRNAAVGAHESSASGVGSLHILPPLYLCRQRCPKTSAPGLPQAPAAGRCPAPSPAPRSPGHLPAAPQATPRAASSGTGSCSHPTAWVLHGLRRRVQPASHTLLVVLPLI